MADSYDAGLLPRTYFRAPRVPFDFRALAMGIVGYIVFWSGGLLLSKICDKDDVCGAFLGAGVSLFDGLPFIGEEIQRFVMRVFQIAPADYDGDGYTFWHKLLGGAWFFVVWSFFGQAIHRITSLRIARDEGLSFTEALTFSAKNWKTVILAPVIVFAAMAFFFGCNALAGLATSIPGLGGLLGLVLIPLAAISSLLILLIGLGGVFGLPLIGAAAAWEVNGSLDAISRAFSYVFARPLQYFWNFLLIFLFAGVILLVGDWFTYTIVKSVDAGTLSDHQSVMIDAPERSNDEDSDYQDLKPEAKDKYVSYAEKTGYGSNGVNAPGRGRPTQPFVRDFQTVVHAPWTYKLNAFIFWLLLNLIWLGAFGYAVYWLLGASSSVYADLRADVDGTEEDEIYLEEDEEDYEALAAGGPTSEAKAEETSEAPEEKPADEKPADEPTEEPAKEKAEEKPKKKKAAKKKAAKKPEEPPAEEPKPDEATGDDDKDDA